MAGVHPGRGTVADLRGRVGIVSSAQYRPGGAVVAWYMPVVQVTGSNLVLVIIFLLQHFPTHINSGPGTSQQISVAFLLLLFLLLSP